MIFAFRKEEEIRKKAEAEEQAKKAEQRRREAEALRKLQERSKAPWAQAAPAPPPTAQASLAEIQRLEREKKAVSRLYLDRFKEIIFELFVIMSGHMRFVLIFFYDTGATCQHIKFINPSISHWVRFTPDSFENPRFYLNFLVF